MTKRKTVDGVKNPKPGMLAYSVKNWCEGTGNAGQRVDQYIATKGEHTYHAYWEFSGRLDWRFVAPEKAQVMHAIASRGGWVDAAACAELLARAEESRTGNYRTPGHISNRDTPDTSGTCEWCKLHSERLTPRQDRDEGMSGGTYEVCDACIRKENKDAQAELDSYDEDNPQD